MFQKIILNSLLHNFELPEKKKNDYERFNKLMKVCFFFQKKKVTFDETNFKFVKSHLFPAIAITTSPGICFSSSLTQSLAFTKVS